MRAVYLHHQSPGNVVHRRYAAWRGYSPNLRPDIDGDGLGLQAFVEAVRGRPVAAGAQVELAVLDEPLPVVDLARDVEPRILVQLQPQLRGSQVQSVATCKHGLHSEPQPNSCSWSELWRRRLVVSWCRNTPAT